MASQGKRMVNENLIKYLKEMDKEGISIADLADMLSNYDASSDVFDGDTLMENVIDQEGNNRFVEGVGTQATVSGLNVSYMKWSLSGTHLMLVAFGTIDNETNLLDAGNGINIIFDIPKYIYDKIYTLQGTATGRIDMKDILIYDYGLSSTQTLKCSIFKDFNNKIKINNYQALTTTANRIFRLQFDLLIDNE